MRLGENRMKDDKPLAIIYTHPRLRSPSSFDQCKYLMQHGKEFNWQIISDQATGTRLDKTVERWGLDTPALVWDQFGAYCGAFKSKEYIEKNNITYIRTVGDTEVHMGEMGHGHHEINTEMDVDALFFPVSPKCKPPIERLKDFTDYLPTQKDKPLICIPFGVDTRKHIPAKEKDIDIIGLYLAESGNPFQQNRIRMSKSMGTYINNNNQNVQAYIQTKKVPDDQLPEHDKMMKRIYADRRTLIGINDTVFHWRYVDFCNRSKVAMADTSKRDYMTNKYLEFGASGCLVIGEKPYGYDDLWNKDTMVEIDMLYIERDVPNALERIFWSDAGKEEMKKKTDKVRQIINRNYSLAHTMDKIEKAFKELI